MANVLITGCSSGFGLLTARQFARKGDTVFATMRNTSKASALEQARDAEKLDTSKSFSSTSSTTPPSSRPSLRRRRLARSTCS